MEGEREREMFPELTCHGLHVNGRLTSFPTQIAIKCCGFAAAAGKSEKTVGSRFQRIVCVGEKKLFIMAANVQGLSAGQWERAR